MLACSSAFTSRLQGGGQNFPLMTALSCARQSWSFQWPLLVLQQKEIIKDQVGGTKVLKEVKHLYWNKGLGQKLVGEGNKGQSGGWGKANSECWPRMQGGREGKEIQSQGKEEAAWPAWSLRSLRGGREEEAVIPDKEGNIRARLKLKSRKSQEEGNENNWNKIRSPN